MTRTLMAPGPSLAPLLALALTLAAPVCATATEATSPPQAADGPPAAQSAEPSVEQLAAWLATARALKAEQPALFDGAEGVLATLVLPDGQGVPAGIRPGDVLIRYGETPLDGARQLVGLTGETPAEQTVTLRWLRPGSPNAAVGAQGLEARIRGGRIGVGIRDLAETPEARMQALLDAGNNAWQRADSALARRQLDAGVELAEAHGDLNWQGRFAIAIGALLNHQGAYEQALRQVNRALEIARTRHDRSMERVALTNLGALHTKLGRYQEALECLRAALAIAREIGDRAGEGNLLTNLASLQVLVGDYDTAISNYSGALAIYRETADRQGESAALRGLAAAHASLGRHEDALRSYEALLALVRYIGDRFAEAEVLNNIGVVYWNLSDHQSALDTLSSALEIRREIADLPGQGQTLANMGNVHNSLRRHDKALDIHEQALAIFQRIHDRRSEGVVVGNIGLAYADAGRTKEALAHYVKALDIHREIGDRSGEARSLLNLAELYLEKSEYQQAQQLLTESLTTQADLAELEIVWRIWDGFRRLFTAVGSIRPAIVSGKRAVNTIQAMRAMSSGLEKHLKRSFLQDKDQVYRRLADLLIAEGRIPEAEQVLAMLKEEELFEFIRRDAARDVKQSRADYTPAEAAWNARYDAVAADLAALGGEYRQLKQNRARTPAEDARRAEVKQQLKAGQQAVTELIAALETEFAGQTPADATRLAAQALRELRLQQARLREMGQGAVILSTVMGDERAERWQVAGLGVSEGHPPFTPLPAVPAELEGIVKRDSADPDGVIPGQVHLDQAFDAARLASVLEDKDAYPVLHIASHFALNPGNNLDSYLLLGDGSRLTIADIDADPDYALFGIDLLALSACDTAVGAGIERASAGAEIESFGALAQLRGARGVLATLWSVDDASTGALMQDLYGQRAEDDRLSKAEALRQAQLALIEGRIRPEQAQTGNPADCTHVRRPFHLGGGEAGAGATCRWTHPYHWAPFVLMGNWL